MRKSKVVILDEATANIDVNTEQKVQQLISEEFKDATMLVIAHRLNTIISSDRVLFLQQGTKLEYDHPITLMNDPTSAFHDLAMEIDKKEKAEKVADLANTDLGAENPMAKKMATSVPSAFQKLSSLYLETPAKPTTLERQRTSW